MMITLIAAALAAAAPAGATADAHAQHQQNPAAPAEHKMDCKCCDKSEGGEKKDCCAKQAGEHAEHDNAPSR